MLISIHPGISLNETVDESVKLVEENYTFGDSFSITIPAHSLMRIDFQ